MSTLTPSRIAPLLVLLLAGCASGATVRSPSFASPDSKRVAGETLMATRQSDLYDAIRSCRPAFFHVRGRWGRVPALYVDGIGMADFNAIHSISLPDVQAVEFMSAPDATTRYGIGHDVGAILVWTKRGRAPR